MLTSCLVSLLSLLCDINNKYMHTFLFQKTFHSNFISTLQPQQQRFKIRLLPDGIKQLPAQAWVSVHAQREGRAGHLPEAEDRDEVRVQLPALLWGRRALCMTLPLFACLASVLLFPPLPSRLRYLIHNHVEELADLCTFSVGESSCRRVVVCHSELRFGPEFPLKLLQWRSGRLTLNFKRENQLLIRILAN